MYSKCCILINFNLCPVFPPYVHLFLHLYYGIFINFLLILDGVEEFWRRDDEGTIKERWLHERPHIFEVCKMYI